MSSATSMFEGEKWDEAYHIHDIVLDTEEIQKYGLGIGNNVTITTFERGKHDLILSAPPVREKVYGSTFEWLKKQRP